jgi:hypothetical protein
MSAEDATATAQLIYEKFRTSRAPNKLAIARAEYLAAFGRPYNDKSLDRELAIARAEFLTAFGRPDDKRSINRQLAECVEDYFGYSRANSHLADAKVPAPIALALYLRSIGRRGRTARSPTLRRQDQVQMDAVWLRIARWKKQKRHPGEVQKKAVEYVATFWPYRGKRPEYRRPENRLTRPEMFDRLQDPGKYGLTPPGVRKKRPGGKAEPESLPEPELAPVPFKPVHGSGS